MTKRASVSAYRTEGGLEPLLSVEHRVQWAALAYGCSTKVTAFPGCCRARHRAVRSCAIPAGTPSSIRFRTWRSDAAKSPGHVDRRQDARADVPRTVPGTRAHGDGRPELSLRTGSLEPGCLTCAEPHPRCKAAFGAASRFPMARCSTYSCSTGIGCPMAAEQVSISSC